MSAFISKWYVNNSLKLPLIPSGTYDFDIDWGDDSPIEHINTYDVTHEYANPGIYDICITGTIKGWRSKDTADYQILDVCQWGCLKLGNEALYFNGCKRLQITATDAPDLSETTTLNGMFSECEEFNSPINHWDVSNIHEMTLMFTLAPAFNQPLNNWNMSNITSITGMFVGARSFNQPLDAWNVSNTTCMMLVFFGARSFNQPIGSWNVSNVFNMASMFSGAISFNQDISTWNVSNVAIMTNMLENTPAFDSTNRSRLLSWNLLYTSVTNDIFGYNQPLIPIKPISLIEWSDKPYILSECAICISEIEDKDMWCAFPCESTIKRNMPHSYHKECIKEWSITHKTCPSCRGNSIINLRNLKIS